MKRALVFAALALTAGALGFAACGRSLPRELRLTDASFSFGDGGENAEDGAIQEGDGALPGLDGSNGVDGSSSDGAIAAMDAGLPDSGDDPCANLEACCMMLPRGLRQRCDMTAMSGDPNQCQQGLDFAHMFGFCGGDGGITGGMNDGGPRMGSDGGFGMFDGGFGMRDGGRRRRDGGAFDAGPRGPNCMELASCCLQVPQQFQPQCLGAAAMGSENQCGGVINVLQQVGIMCTADGGS